MMTSPLSTSTGTTDLLVLKLFFCSNRAMFRSGLRASLIVVLVVLSGCGGEDPIDRAQDGSTPGPTEAESLAPSPSPDSDGDETLPSGVMPTMEGLLKPGSYQTSVFEPHATFAVPKGWRIPFEEANNITIARKIEPRDEVIYIDSSQPGLDLDTALKFARSSFTVTTGVKRDFLFSRPAPVTIGDFRGRGTTMEVRTDQLIVTLALGTEAYEARPGDRIQLNAIVVEGRTILVFVEAPGARFKSFLREARPVLASLAF